MITNLFEAPIKIYESKFLPAGTVWMSSDLYKLLKEQLTEEGKDKTFLKKCGIGGIDESV